MQSPIPGMHQADWIVLGVYFLVILIAGLWSALKLKDGNDFFMGGRRFGKLFMTFFAFGSGAKGQQNLIDVSGTGGAGPAGGRGCFLWLPVIPFCWLIAPLLRRMRALTTADFFGARFGPGTAVLYSVYGILISITFIAGALFSSGTVINTLTGNALDDMARQLDFQVPDIALVEQISSDESSDGRKATTGLTISRGWRSLKGHDYVILAMTLLFVTYGMAGGLNAVVITDFIQSGLVIAFSILFLPYIFFQADGPALLRHTAGAQVTGLSATSEIAGQSGPEPFTAFHVCVLTVTALCGLIVQPHTMAVCGAGRTELESRIGFTAGSFLKVSVLIAWLLAGLTCTAWYSGSNSSQLQSDSPADSALHASSQQENSRQHNGLPDTDKAETATPNSKDTNESSVRVLRSLLPAAVPGLAGLLIASLLAAAMSTSDTQMTVSSGLFTENIYKRHIAPGRSDRHYLWVGRFAGFAIVASAVILQMTFTDVIHAMQVVMGTAAVIGISMWFGLFWRQWNRTAVWVSTTAAVATWFIVSHYGNTISTSIPEADFMFRQTAKGMVMLNVWQCLCYLTAGVVSGILTSIMTVSQSPQQLDEFFVLLRTPVEEDEAVEAPCVVPEFNLKRDPVIEWAGFQIPRPTKQGMVGFAASWLLVLLIIGTVKLSGLFF